ncbi:hypothetical protein BDR07DRAFT_13622 [Suillus spraguei]|nr:hypothetical protein BDR07DRAFT_13622 [Suillus spraguei]
MKPEWMENEEQRITDLCKWGQKYGLNGFVRMQINFEVMICNFTSHMEVVSFLNLESPRFVTGPPIDWPENPTSGERSCPCFDIGLIYSYIKCSKCNILLHGVRFIQESHGRI